MLITRAPYRSAVSSCTWPLFLGSPEVKHSAPGSCSGSHAAAPDSLSLSCLRLPVTKQLPQALLALLRTCRQPFQAPYLGSCPAVAAAWVNRCSCPQLSSLQVDTVECWLLQQPEEEGPPPSGHAGSVLDRQGLRFKGLVTAGWAAPHSLRLCLLLPCSQLEARPSVQVLAWAA